MDLPGDNLLGIHQVIIKPHCRRPVFGMVTVAGHSLPSSGGESMSTVDPKWGHGKLSMLASTRALFGNQQPVAKFILEKTL